MFRWVNDSSIVASASSDHVARNFLRQVHGGWRSSHKHNLPGGSLDAHQVWTCHNWAVYTSKALGTSGLPCLPHILLMAICGHYSPPMSHTNAPLYRLCSSRASTLGFCHNTTAAVNATAAAVIVGSCGCCYLCFFSHSTPLNTWYWPTSMPAFMQGDMHCICQKDASEIHRNVCQTSTL